MQAYRIEKWTIDGQSIDSMMEGIPTPRDFKALKRAQKAFPSLEKIDRHLTVNSMRYGRVYGFIQEQRGATVQNLFPIKKNEGTQISSSSKTTLEMHTETAFHRWRPEIVGLFCVRDDPMAGTNVAALPDIIEQLDQHTIKALHKPLFRTSLDESFQNPNQPNAYITTSVLSDNSTSLTYDRALMTGMTDETQDALSKLSDAIDKVTETIVLKTGELLLLNNRTAVHGRTPFQARYDGTDRWLKRVMVSTRLPDYPELAVNGGRNLVVMTRF